MSKEVEITITKDTEVNFIVSINDNELEISAKGLKIFDIIEWFDAVVDSVDRYDEFALHQRAIFVDVDGLLLDYSRQNRWILVEKLVNKE